jgi:ferric-dicitrate binding protein FerR (iron transport regulator)
MARKRSWGLILIAAIWAVLCLVLGWFILQPAKAPDAITALVKELSGGVDFVRGAAERIAAYTGLQLEPKDEVYTAGDGRVRLDLSDGTITRLGPNTLFVMGSTDRKGDGLIYRVTLYMGEIWIILKGGGMEVATPYGLASVQGSFMHVKIGREVEETVVTCLEGSCTVGNEEGQVDLVAGLGARMTNLKASPEVRRMSPEEVQEWLETIPEALDMLPQLSATLEALPAELPTARAGVRDWCPGAPGWVSINAQAGDTLASLAQPLGVNPAELAHANCIDPNAELKPGAMLFAPFDPNGPIPTNRVTTTAAATLPPAPSATAALTLTSPQPDLPPSSQSSQPTLPFTLTQNIFSGCDWVTEIPVAECTALETLYTSAKGPGKLESAGWGITNTPCGWAGVVNCSSGHVTSINLNNYLLSGSIPAELGNLIRLQQLDLSGNPLSGPMPDSLQNLTELQDFSYPASVCVPNTPEFTTWIDAVANHSAYTLCP